MTLPGVGQVTVHRASVVLPVDGPGIADGAVAVRGDRIVVVGGFDDVMDVHPDGEVVAWDGVMTPGLVNAHTHLQYTGFAELGHTIHASFLTWSDAFIGHYDRWRQGALRLHGAATGEPSTVHVAGHEIVVGDWHAAARAGAELGLASGTTAFADVVTDFEVRDVLAELGLAGVAYLELLGLDEPRWQAAEAELRAAIEAARRSPAFEIGVSPHTPYSVDEPVLRASAALARELRLRLHVHLAEVDGEQEFYRTATGPLAERLARIVPDTWYLLAQGGTGLGAGEFADRCDLLGPDSHVAHGVHLDADDRRLLRERATVVALCPRSNEVVGTGVPPVAALLEEGNEIAVGTDSLSSSPSLDVLEDVARLHELAREQGYRRDDLAERLLRAASLGGATAMGMGHHIGALRVDARADLAIFDVTTEPTEAVRQLVTAGAGRCIGVVAAGVVRRS